MFTFFANKQLIFKNQFFLDNNNNVNINNFNEVVRSIDDRDFLELIFGVDSFKNGKWLDEFHNSNLKCAAEEESVWEVFEKVNNDVLFEIEQIIRKNPGCTQFVKCELSYFVPKSIKK